MQPIANPSNILTTTDFSDEALNGIDYAAWLAKLLDCEVTLLHIVEDYLPPIIFGMSEHKRRQALEAQAERATQTLNGLAEARLPGIRTQTSVLIGSPAKEIVRFAKEHEVNFVVMASRGYGLVGQLLIGSTTERVLHRAPCPVLVAPAKPL